MLGRRIFAEKTAASVSGRDRSNSRAVRRPGVNARDGLGWAGVALLLFTVVASAIGGAEAVFFSTVLFAWLLFPILVGLRNTLDAGCTFMLISLGVMLVVGLAQNGPGLLLP